MAQDASVRAADGLLSLGQTTALRWTGGSDTMQLLLALTALRDVAAFLYILVDQAATGRANTGKMIGLRLVTGLFVVWKG